MWKISSTKFTSDNFFVSFYKCGLGSQKSQKKNTGSTFQLHFCVHVIYIYIDI